MKWIKDNWTMVVIGILFLLLFFNRNPWGCNEPSQEKRDTLIVRDTTHVLQPPVIVKEYVPIQYGSQAPIVIPPSYQPSQNYEQLVKQYNDLAQKFLSVNSYQDSITLKDTSGRRVGVVNIADKVSENKIISRVPSYQLQFPTIRETTTITVTPPPRTQVYLGTTIGGPQLMVGGNIILKNKKDQLYMIGAQAIPLNGRLYPQATVGIAWKIKF